MLKRLIILYVLLLGVLSVNAQYDPSFSHYFDMEPSFNPASVGKQAKLNVTGAYAIDLAGYEHNPRTMYVSADMPFYLLKNYHGVGLQLMNDQIGLFTHQRLAAQYAFKRRLFGGMLSAGIQAGFISESFDGSKVDVEEGNDPALPKTNVNGNSVDIGAGVYYMHGAWYVGVSAQHLTKASSLESFRPTLLQTSSIAAIADCSALILLRIVVSAHILPFSSRMTAFV